MPTIQQLSGHYLVQPSSRLAFTNVSYQCISQVDEYDKKYRAIIVPVLDPNLFLLFSLIDIIVTESGSPLSHLALLGREYNKPIFLSKEIHALAESTGKLNFDHTSLHLHHNE